MRKALLNIAKGKPQGYLDWALAAAAKNPNFNEAVFAPGGIGQDYNYNLAYMNGDNPGLNGHLSDIGKLLNHPTVSNESASALGHTNQVGHWMPPVDPDSSWIYNNPSKGLNLAPESAAYQPQSPDMQLMAKIYNALNNPRLLRFGAEGQQITPPRRQF